MIFPASRNLPIGLSLVLGVPADGVYDVPFVNEMNGIGVNETPCKRVFVAPVTSVVNDELELASVTDTNLLSVVVA